MTVMASPSPCLPSLITLTGVLVLLLQTLSHMPASKASPVTTDLDDQIALTLPKSNVEQEKNFCDSLKRLGHRGRQIRHLIKMGASLTLCEGSASPNTHEEQQQSENLLLSVAGPTNPDDVEALKALYNATNGKGWRNSDHWLQGDPCGNHWNGITCSPEGRVTEIDLYNNGLIGHIPPQVAKASQLLKLILFSNKLTGEIPLEIYAMKSLQVLSIYDNQLTGSLPQTISMPNLTTFFVFFNQLVGPLPSVWDTPNLVDLDVGHNQFSGPLPDALGKLDHLQSLYIDYSKGIDGTVPESYGNLLRLTDISLAADNLTNFTIPQSWSKFSNLSYLQLSDLTGELPAWMGQSWPKLSILLIFGSNISGGIPESVGQLSNLLSLDMYSLGLSGSVPESFSGLVQVFELNLSGNKLSTIPDSLLKSLFMHIPLYFCNLGSNPWSCSINSIFIDYCEASCSECNSGGRHSNQALCLQHKGCGWCDDGPNCLEGNATGPTSFSCSSWHFGQ